MIVVDASAYLKLLLDLVPDAERLHFDADLAAPELLFVEIASGLSRSVRRGLLSGLQAMQRLDEVLDAPVEITAISSLAMRGFELRDDVSLYDACYVALAEQLGCGILTADARLAGAPGIAVPFTVI